MSKQFIRGYFKTNEEGKLVIVASDETLDRHGDVLKLEYWDLSEFKKAPRLLVDHDHRVESIVGKAENTRIDTGLQALTFEPVFHGITQLSREVKEMVEQGFLDTVSVGFIPHGPEGDGGNPRYELIEISFVTVGANPNARVKAFQEKMKEAKITDEEKGKIEEFAEMKQHDCTKCFASSDKIATLESEIATLKSSLSESQKEVKRLDAHCEKLQTALTTKNKKILNDNASKAMLKEVARVVNQGLYKLNKS